MSEKEVAPVRERGLKSPHMQLLGMVQGRSREGAWIEMLTLIATLPLVSVAPVRERGLKFPQVS